MDAEYRARFTRQALDDIDDINEFIGLDSPRNAARMIERMFDTIDSPEVFPHRTVIERFGDLFQFPVRSIRVHPYVIYFWVIESDKVVVVRHIRHGSRQPPESVD